jgi:hypothetical protein
MLEKGWGLAGTEAKTPTPPDAIEIVRLSGREDRMKPMY